MAWIRIRAGISRILALPPNIAAARKPLLQVNLKGTFPVQAACVSGSSVRDKSKARPAPFPYKTTPYNLWRAWLQDTTTHRFDENTKIIAVEGPVAAGKSKFAKSLAEDLDMLHLPEVTMDDYYINSYGYDLRKLDPQLPPSARSYDEKNFCVEPSHENAANFQILKYKLRYSQYIDALAHLMNTGWYLLCVHEPVFSIFPYWTSATFVLHFQHFCVLLEIHTLFFTHEEVSSYGCLWFIGR